MIRRGVFACILIALSATACQSPVRQPLPFEDGFEQILDVSGPFDFQSLRAGDADARGEAASTIVLADAQSCTYAPFQQTKRHIIRCSFGTYHSPKEAEAAFARVRSQVASAAAHKGMMEMTSEVPLAGPTYDMVTAEVDALLTAWPEKDGSIPVVLTFQPHVAPNGNPQEADPSAEPQPTATPPRSPLESALLDAFDAAQSNYATNVAPTVPGAKSCALKTFDNSHRKFAECVMFEGSRADAQRKYVRLEGELNTVATHLDLQGTPMSTDRGGRTYASDQGAVDLMLQPVPQSQAYRVHLDVYAPL